MRGSVKNRIWEFVFGSIFFVGFIVSVVAIHYFAVQGQNSDKPVTIAVNGAVSSEKDKLESEPFVFLLGSPVRLRIPKINVDAALEYVGLTSDGAMDAPKDLGNVAWFDLGPRPGDNGSAVMAGHYGLKDGQPSVFDNLYKLRKGDKLYVEDDKGDVISFVVRENRRYTPDADASSIFISSDGMPHLNLVTCEGDWSESLKTYPQRLVVFADIE